MNAPRIFGRPTQRPTPSLVRRMVAPALGAASLVGATVAGCNPATFVDLADDAPVVALGRPDGFRRTGYGTTVASIEGPLGNGALATRLAVGGGPDTGTWIYDVWNADDVGTFRISNTACETPADDCVTGTGSAITGFPQYGGEGACLAIGEASANQVRIKCESSPGNAVALSAGVGAALEFGFAVAGVPAGAATDARSVVLTGAPAAGSGRGTLFRIPPTGAPSELNEIVDTAGVVSGRARLGEAIATASLPDAATRSTSFPTVPQLGVDTPFLAAVSAPGDDRVLIVVVGVDPLNANDIDAQVLACFDGPAGFGQALVAGDVDGDGMPEVYMGFAETTTDHPGTVHVFDVADLTTLEAGCTDTTDVDDPALTVIACPTLDGVDCAGSAFGSALALGDVNADGTLDLIAGAPRTTVEETLGAGGVFALAGSATGVDGAMASFMRISHPGTDDRLGASVATLRTHYGITGVTPRHEVAAGAPGANTAFIFLCSGLGDDASTTGDRCLELATE
ncbi:MAG: integrin alpha [Polyangiales bacterium]|nr:FG-GAP repeat protein [Myxococcales bacterium]